MGKKQTVAALARRYGVSEQSLYRWRDEFISGGKSQLSGKERTGSNRSEVESLKREIAERDQVIGEITIANRILKKVGDGSL